MKLTPGQKAARRAVKAAAKKVIAEVDSMNWRKECVEFRADFHLSCIRYDKGTMNGKAAQCDMPVYSGTIIRR